ncbi:hypothetical protein TrVFT333_010836 [Trichoderma virens FT-333]|nr:hypothetical protein TrVFT333_010836 [Trichoderma virens FT-333]
MANTILMLAEDGTKGNFDTFHPFTRLPLELKCMIQDFYIRDFQRGAHFFATSENPRRIGRTLRGSIFNIENGHGLDLVAPKSLSKSNSVQDWMMENSSAYVKDGAFWTTCWESRDIMTMRYRQLSEQLSTNQFISCKFTRNQERFEFKVSPEKDLFCIQPQHTRIPWCIMPFYRLPGSSSLTRLTNTAIEYDPAWLDTGKSAGGVPWLEDSPWGCFIRTLWAVAEGRMHNGFQFWIIDRNIQRRDKPWATSIPIADSDTDEEEKPEPLVFQGFDKRYVEVRGLEECTWDALKQNTAFHFLHWLQIDAGFGTGWMMMHRGRLSQDNPPLQYRDLDELVKVVCEEKL